jgi:membrane-associated protein
MGFDIVALIKSIGYFGVWAIIFTETGILFGVFLPGDMLLFAVGVLAAQGVFDITIITAGCFAAAMIGNMVGYEIGRRMGLPFIKKYASGFITDDHLAKTELFFQKHGRSGIVIARFLPVARTVAPFLAGVTKMNYGMYMLYSAVGALLWAVGLPLLGYFLGGLIPPEKIDYIIIPVVAIIIAIIAWPWIKKKIKFKKQQDKE